MWTLPGWPRTRRPLPTLILASAASSPLTCAAQLDGEPLTRHIVVPRLQLLTAAKDLWHRHRWLKSPIASAATRCERNGLPTEWRKTICSTVAYQHRPVWPTPPGLVAHHLSPLLQWRRTVLPFQHVHREPLRALKHEGRKKQCRAGRYAQLYHPSSLTCPRTHRSRVRLPRGRRTLAPPPHALRARED